MAAVQSMVGKPIPPASMTATAEVETGPGQAGSPNPSITSTSKPSIAFGTQPINLSSTALPTASQKPPYSPPSPSIRNSSYVNWNHSLGTSIGVPIACLGIIGTVLCLLYRRKKIREKREAHRREEEKVDEEYTNTPQRVGATENGPCELEARTPTKPYAKPELSDDARKRIAELSAEHLRELAANQIFEMPAG
ncbi:MAG: hypothetical protein Q9209_005756 [Squamulea sp. 1 TL-2023]